jgi:hypothetical protein
VAAPPVGFFVCPGRGELEDESTDWAGICCLGTDGDGASRRPDDLLTNQASPTLSPSEDPPARRLPAPARPVPTQLPRSQPASGPVRSRCCSKGPPPLSDPAAARGARGPPSSVAVIGLG